MITEKDYYEAKRIVAEYESRQLNKLDVSGQLAMRFNRWLRENGWDCNINGRGWFNGNSRFMKDEEVWASWVSSGNANYS